MKIRCWYIVYGKNDECPHPSQLHNSIRPAITNLIYNCKPNEINWTNSQFTLSTTSVPVITINRTTIGESQFEDEVEKSINAYATIQGEKYQEMIINHLRHTRQILHILPTGLSLGNAQLARVCEQVCGFLARETSGIIQVFQEGFFNPQGQSLMPHNPKHKLNTN
ncbi:MAG: hypothetical protein ACKVT0_14550 [Planctomycetaceae bacterium]